MWETILQSLLQSPKCQAGEKIIDSLDAGAWVLHRRSYLDSLSNQLVEQQHDAVIGAVVSSYIVFGILVILMTLAMWYYYEKSAAGQKRVATLYQKTLEKKGAVVKS